jgi:hypothetical protein
MKNVPEASNCTYTLLLCEEHARNFTYRLKYSCDELEECAYGLCTEDPAFRVYLSGQVGDSSYTPRLKENNE